MSTFLNKFFDKFFDISNIEWTLYAFLFLGGLISNEVFSSVLIMVLYKVGITLYRVHDME